MKEETIRPNKARALGVITPPLSEMLALNEEITTNHFFDVMTRRTDGTTKHFKGTNRNSINLGTTALNVNIVVDQVIFYKEHPEQNWFGLSVFIEDTNTRVGKGNLKIYVRDVDGIMDADVLIKDYTISDSVSLGWQIGNLNWQGVLDAFAAKNTHPFRWFNVKVVYTDSTQEYRNKTVYPPRRIGYATHPIVMLSSEFIPTNSNLATVQNGEIIGTDEEYNKTATSSIETDTGTFKVYATILDGLDAPIKDITCHVSIQDTQETHTINNTTYGLSGDMYLGTNNTNDKTDANGNYEWSWNIPNNFLDTTESRTRRHIFTTLFIAKNDLLFPGGTGIRQDNGLEYRIQWTYLQPATVQVIQDASHYAIRNFNYFVNVLDAHNNNVPCKLIAKVNGITIHDANDETLVFERDVTTNVFHVEFDYPYLHAGNNDVQLKLVTDYDYNKEGIHITANCPLMHYMISVPSITGSFGDAGRVTLEYTVGTIENDELPYCNIWDLKLNDETLVARDKTLIGGEWNGEYHSIIGTKATNLVSSEYNNSTGKLTIVMEVQELNAGDYTLKLVLPETDAIQGGNNTSTFTVQQRDPLRHLLTIDENWKKISKLDNTIDVANPPAHTEYIHANTTTNTLVFNVPGFLYVYLASLQDLFSYYNNEFNFIVYKGGSDGRYEFGFMRYALDTNDNHSVDSNSIYRLGYVGDTSDVSVISEETSYGQIANEVLFSSWNEFTFQKIGNNIHIWYCSQGTTGEHFTIPIGNMDLSRYYLYTSPIQDASLYLTTNQSLVDYPSDFVDTRAETELNITTAEYVESSSSIEATAQLKSGNTILKGSSYTIQILFDSRYPVEVTPIAITGNIQFTESGRFTSGTHIITFKFEGDENYKPCSISTNIIVP